MNLDKEALLQIYAASNAVREEHKDQLAHAHKCRDEAKAAAGKNRDELSQAAAQLHALAEPYKQATAALEEQVRLAEEAKRNYEEQQKRVDELMPAYTIKHEEYGRARELLTRARDDFERVTADEQATADRMQEIEQKVRDAFVVRVRGALSPPVSPMQVRNPPSPQAATEEHDEEDPSPQSLSSSSAAAAAAAGLTTFSGKRGRGRAGVSAPKRVKVGVDSTSETANDYSMWISQIMRCFIDQNLAFPSWMHVLTRLYNKTPGPAKWFTMREIAADDIWVEMAEIGFIGDGINPLERDSGVVRIRLSFLDAVRSYLDAMLTDRRSIARN